MTYPQQPQNWQPPPQQPYGYGPPPAGYPQQRYTSPPRLPAPKKPRRWPWVLVGIPALLVVLIGLAAALDGGTPSGGSSSGSGSAQPAVVAPPAPAQPITARDWALIAKDPDAHKGRRIIVWGEVTQFDAATGATGFRANVDGVEHPVKYGYADYETNTVLTGSKATLAQLVENDLFKAEVTVLGSYSYDTQIGGSTTVPQLEVTAITVIGSTA